MAQRDSDGRPTLTRLNWGWYELEIESYLSSKGVLRYAKGTVIEFKPKDAANPTESEYRLIEEYQRFREKAAGELWLSIEDSLRPQFSAKRGDPAELLKALKAKFHLQVPGTRFAAFNDFFNIALDDPDAPATLQTLLTRIDQAIARVQSLRPAAGYDITTMDEELCAMVALRALATSSNSQHETLYTSLLVDKNMTYSTLKDVIDREFAARGMADNADPLAANRAGFTPTCANCRGPHFLRECKEFVPLWKQREEAAANAAKAPNQRGQGKKKKNGGNAANAQAAPAADASSSSPQAASAARVESAGQVPLYT